MIHTHECEEARTRHSPTNNAFWFGERVDCVNRVIFSTHFPNDKRQVEVFRGVVLLIKDAYAPFRRTHPRPHHLILI